MAWHVDAAALERYAASRAFARAARVCFAAISSSSAIAIALLSQYAMAQIAQCATSRDAHMH